LSKKKKFYTQKKSEDEIVLRMAIFLSAFNFTLKNLISSFRPLFEIEKKNKKNVQID